MGPTLDRDVVARYARFSLYNSPYPAHDRGHAVDLYPDAAGPVPSPVAGEVAETRTVRAPSRRHAVEHDHLLLVDTGDHVARILHVDPALDTGDHLAVGDPLGRTVRSGYFAPWVDDHVHLEFRDAGRNQVRATGSLRLAMDIDPVPVAWDGTGTVVETGDTYALLDSPAHPVPGERFAGVAAETPDGPVALDGGLVHYAGGGAHGGDGSGPLPAGPLSLLGTHAGTVDDRTVEWADVAVRANGERITGLSLFLAREQFGVKLVCPGTEFAAGDRIEVTAEPCDDPIHLG